MDETRTIELEELFIDPNDALKGIVNRLAGQLSLLSEDDQNFVLGCQANLGMAEPITAENIRRIQQIAIVLKDSQHQAVTVDGALTLKRMLQGLAAVRQTLTKPEYDFANALAVKLQAKQRFTQPETLALVHLYTSKAR
jgi:putative SOS response-associated peptidase YedK